MAEPNAAPATTTTEAAVVEDSLLAKADQPVVSKDESVLDTAGAEEKAAREAEDKRLLETKDEDLKTPEEKTRKAELVKVKQEAADKATAEIRAKGVPEKYDLKAPEGVTLDEAGLAKVTPFFKELQLNNSQAQKAIDFFAQIKKEETATNEATLKSWNETNTKETMDALGANAKTELAYVAKVKSMMSPETIEALNASGIGNLKHFIFDMAKIGKLFSEEHLVNDKITRKPATGLKSNEEMAEQFYPTMAPK
jgi:hypothetical protein